MGRLIAVRGIDVEQAADFLEPTLRALLPDPSVLMDMDRTALRLADAVRRGETVAVFGDYDVDGACSAAIMASMLRGVRRSPKGATTHSMVMRSKSGTVRFVEAFHNFTTKTWASY